MKDGQIRPPFTIETLLAPGAQENADIASASETKLSAYGRDRKEVEKEMNDLLQRRLEMIREEKKRIADMMPPPKKEYN
jgi:plasmid maintenance system killer protein